MSFRRPTILTLLLSLVAMVTMIGLGLWQLERRDWKLGVLATVEDRLSRLPEPMPADPGVDWEFRRVSVQGPIVGGRWFRFHGRTRNKEAGDALMLLVQRDDGSLVAVEHGWVEFNGELPPLPLVLAAEGILRAPAKPGLFTPDNDPEANAWYKVDPATMAKSAGLAPDKVHTMYLKPADWQPSLPNDHLQYAITWFSLAGVFVIIFAVFHRRRD